MMAREEELDRSDGDWFLNKSQVRERPFTSSTPIIGNLIVRFREMWNSIATKWYIRPLLQQQNAFNRLVVAQLQEHDQWFIIQDREQTDLAHDAAQMTAHLAQLNRHLQAMNDQLAQLETPSS